MKFTKQHNKLDCGPVVIVNASKWAGKPLSYRKYKKYFSELFKLKEFQGVHEVTLTSYLTNNKFPFKVQEVKKPLKLNQIKKYLSDPNRVIILGICHENYRHVGLLIQITDTTVTLINWANHTIFNMNLEYFKRYINKHTIGYIITK